MGGGVMSVYRFVVEEHDLILSGLRAPLRLAWLTDLHYGPFVRSGSVAAWVDATLAARPDLVLLGGDIMDFSSRNDQEPLLTQLRRLRAPLGTFTVWGNHDVRRFGAALSGFAASLATAGVQALRNQGVRVREDLYLAGLDDLREGEPDLGAALAGRPAEGACLLMSHNPDVLPLVPDHVGLTLCGHTHGGQVRLPLIGPVVTSSRYGRRFASGWVTGPARGYVSRGLGVAQIPLRIACPAELTLMNLHPEPGPGA